MAAMAGQWPGNGRAMAGQHIRKQAMRMENHPWPMNILTRDAGGHRRLIVKPIDMTPRENLRPDSEGNLRIVDIDKVKIHNCICVPEVKEQGHFQFYCRNSDGEYKVFGRKQNVNGYFIDIYDKLDGMKLPSLPKETVVAMELIWPKHPDSQVPTAIKDCPDELRMRAFGVPIYRGALLFGPTSLPYNRGRRLLEHILPPEVLVKNFAPMEFGGASQSAKVLERLLQLARELCIEGFVLKERAYYGWWKIKGTKEADVYVTGFKVSESDTQCGMVTAVFIAVYDLKNKQAIPMGSVTGFTLEEKQKMTDAYKSHGDSGSNPFMGRTLRVLYQEVAGKGKLKHGFFDGWRSDKSYWECSAEQFWC